MQYLWQIFLIILGAIMGVVAFSLLSRPVDAAIFRLIKKRYGGKSERNISGLWITQYMYPSASSEKGKIETQLVVFKQRKDTVFGKTLHADKHPEVFEGKITLDRYFTGLYMNTINYHNYHGAFQFVLSNSKGRMKGKWIGFDRTGSEVGSGEWRWEQVFNTAELTEEMVQDVRNKAKSMNLFNDNDFIM